jgi:hypothetical protein
MILVLTVKYFNFIADDGIFLFFLHLDFFGFLVLPIISGCTARVEWLYSQRQVFELPYCISKRFKQIHSNCYSTWAQDVLLAERRSGEGARHVLPNISKQERMQIVLPQAFLKINLFCLTCSKSHEETELQITRHVPEIIGQT